MIERKVPFFYISLTFFKFLVVIVDKLKVKLNKNKTFRFWKIQKHIQKKYYVVISKCYIKIYRHSLCVYGKTIQINLNHVI